MNRTLAFLGAAMLAYACRGSSPEFSLQVNAPPGAFAVLRESGGVEGIHETWVLYPDGRVVGGGRTVGVTGGARAASQLFEALKSGGLLQLPDGAHGRPGGADWLTTHLVLMENGKRHDYEVRGPGPLPLALQDAMGRVQAYVQAAVLH